MPKEGNGSEERTGGQVPAEPPAREGEFDESVRKGSQVMPENPVPPDFDPPSAGPVVANPAVEVDPGSGSGDESGGEGPPSGQE